MLRIGLLKNWVNADFSEDYFEIGMKALSSDQCLYLIIEKKDGDSDFDTEDSSACENTDDFDPNIVGGSQSSNSYFNHSDKIKSNKKTTIEKLNEPLKNKIRNEINLFREKIINEVLKPKFDMGTAVFWKKNSHIFPNLYKLALVLLNIQASGAFVERFFSICGVICNKRNTNMKDDFLIMRAMMKANINILRQINKDHGNKN